MSQTEKLYSILQDGQPHRVDELLDRVYGVIEGFAVARFCARIFDLKRRYRVEIKSWPDSSNRKLWVYQMVKEYEKKAQRKEFDLEKKLEITRNMVFERKKEIQTDLFGFAA